MNLQGLLRVGVFNVGGVCENSRFWPLCRNILQRCIRPQIPLITYRKSHMSFAIVPISMTLRHVTLNLVCKNVQITFTMEQNIIRYDTIVGF